jgi:hypothetical protein
LHKSTVRFLRHSAFLFLDELASAEYRFGRIPFAVTAHFKVLRKRIDGLGPDAVQAYAELENFVAVFRSGVDARNALDDLAERNSAAVIAHRDLRPLQAYDDPVAKAHDVFVNGVVDNFLQKDVNAVVVIGSVADTADVHARALADVLEG